MIFITTNLPDHSQCYRFRPKKCEQLKPVLIILIAYFQGESQDFLFKKKETWKLWGTVNIIGDKKDYLGALDCSYIKWYPTFDRAISMIQWIQYNGDQHFRGWRVLFWFFVAQNVHHRRSQYNPFSKRSSTNIKQSFPWTIAKRIGNCSTEICCPPEPSTKV